MKRMLLLLIAMLGVGAVASAAPAQKTAIATVSITSAGFAPEDLRVQPGDTVTWKNNDTQTHQIVSDTGLFKSPTLSPGQTYSRQFDVEASYSYHDGNKASSTGTVNVLARNVSIGLTRPSVVYKNPVRIFGSIPNEATGEAVTLHFTPYRKPAFTKTVVTEQGGYEFTYRPTIRTDVYATWKGTTSHASPTIGVRPLVIFRTLNAALNRYLVRVQAARSYGRNLVRIQRQNQRGVWVTTLRVQLNARGQKRFTGKFPHGVTKAQATVPKHPGYIAGFSTVKTIVR
jgi:plastocyanin